MRHGGVGDRELPGRDVGQQIERTAERVAVVHLLSGQQEDLRVEPLQGELELVLVANCDDAVEPELEGLGVLAREPVAVLPRVLDGDEPGVRAGERSLGRRAGGAPEDRQLGHLLHVGDRCAYRDRLGALRLGFPRAVEVVDVDDHRDAVALRDGLTEPAVASHGGKVPIGRPDARRS